MSDSDKRFRFNIEGGNGKQQRSASLNPHVRLICLGRERPNSTRLRSNIFHKYERQSIYTVKVDIMVR